MQNPFKKHSQLLIVVITIAIGLCLMASAVAMIFKYKTEITERSSSTAKYNTLIAQDDVYEKLSGFTLKAVEVAGAVSSMDSIEDVKSYLSSLNGTELSDVHFCRYFNDGVFYSEVGEDITFIATEDSALTYHNNSPDTAGYVGTFSDTIEVGVGSMLVVGFYAPVTGSSYLDGVVIYYVRQALVESLSGNSSNPLADFTVVCTGSGEIISGGERIDGAEIFNAIKSKTGRKDVADSTRNLVNAKKSGTVFTKIGLDDYVISVACDENKLQDLAVIEMYKVDKLYQSTFDILSAVIGVVIVFALVVVGVVCYLIVSSVKMRKQIFNMETQDVALDCFNRHGFEKEAKKILSVNQNSYFAIIVMELRHYKHLLETCGESETSSLLAYLRLTLSKTVTIEETYGHGEEGQFFILLHAKDRKGLLERLKVHSFLAKQYNGVNKFNVLLRYGIYEYMENEVVTVTQMIDFANEANNTLVRANEENSGMQFNFYNDELRQIRMINESMELRMESALENGEFQIFYQPKYNLNLKRQDGCEALVRWYDQETGEYNRPALFMKLFESNGFIIKIDKYVYTKVCEYISYSIAHGRTVYPVSVNISRVTAIQPDFVEFYTKIKKKYNIPDGQLMIEFTESFAYENYETLKGIVDKLHENGFKCSIDDFGCGYSSYRILKSLPMDEIKLDKFFLERGDSEERDRHIFESIISLAKKLGMKVTQEGVETGAELEKIISLGCDVVQGYYYSHPMGLNDYIEFVAHTREHNIT